MEENDVDALRYKCPYCGKMGRKLVTEDYDGRMFNLDTVEKVIGAEQSRHGMGSDAWLALEMVLREFRGMAGELE